MSTLPSWLIYCRPGFERDCVEETRAKPIETEDNSGYVVLQGKPNWLTGNWPLHASCCACIRKCANCRSATA